MGDRAEMEGRAPVFAFGVQMPNGYIDPNTVTTGPSNARLIAEERGGTVVRVAITPLALLAQSEGER